MKSYGLIINYMGKENECLDEISWDQLVMRLGQIFFNNKMRTRIDGSPVNPISKMKSIGESYFSYLQKIDVWMKYNGTTYYWDWSYDNFDWKNALLDALI
jgi:hypothetical protein